MEIVKCDYCNKELTCNMPIEYSDWIGEYYCNRDCATDRYYEYLGSHQLDTSNKDSTGMDGILIIGNKLYNDE